MDKYLILIKKLETELANLDIEVRNIENEIKEKKLKVSNLESIITVTSNKINTNQIKIDDKRNMKSSLKNKRINFLKIFAIFFLILSLCLLLPSFLFGVFTGIISKILISLSISTFLVGGTYVLTTNDDLKYLNSIDVKKLYDEGFSLSEMIKEKNAEKNQTEHDIKSLEEKRSKLQESITQKKETLNKTSKVRNEIIESILSKLVEQEIINSTSLSEVSRQKILNK